MFKPPFDDQERWAYDRERQTWLFDGRIVVDEQKALATPPGFYWARDANGALTIVELRHDWSANRLFEEVYFLSDENAYLPLRHQGELLDRIPEPKNNSSETP